MKKVLFMMSLLLTLGMFSACSSDEDMIALKDSKLSLFEDSLQSLSSVSADEYVGYMLYDRHQGWYIRLSSICGNQPNYYYPLLNIPEELKEEGIKVSFSGQYIRMTDEEVESLDIKNNVEASFYFVYLTKIERIEEEEIPYRGTPPFTITDMLGRIGYEWDEQRWFIYYVSGNMIGARYYPTELSEEFKYDPHVETGPEVIISGNVYEDITGPHEPGMSFIMKYKIELTKIEKVE